MENTIFKAKQVSNLMAQKDAYARAKEQAKQDFEKIVDKLEEQQDKETLLRIVNNLVGTCDTIDQKLNLELKNLLD